MKNLGLIKRELHVILSKCITNNGLPVLQNLFDHVGIETLKKQLVFSHDPKEGAAALAERHSQGLAGKTSAACTIASPPGLAAAGPADLITLRGPPAAPPVEPHWRGWQGLGQ